MAQAHHQEMYLPMESSGEPHSVYDYCYQYNLNASGESEEANPEASKVG